MSHVTTLGIDIAKNQFQICALNQARKVVFNQSVSRAKLLDVVRRHPVDTLIAMEACASSHHWARTFSNMGFQVRLLPAQHVKAYLQGNKNDANDALAIAESANRPNLHPVAVKTIEQQDIQALLRIRTGYKDSRHRLVNQVRALLSEYGIIMPKTLHQFERYLPQILEDADNGLTALVRESLWALQQDYRYQSKKVKELDQQLNQLAKHHPIAKQLMRLRGIGPITSLALFACVGNGHQFQNARQLSAWLGLVPTQYGTGGKVRLGAMSKRGNRYLRVLLIHGARTVMNWMKKKTDSFSLWANSLTHRRGKHKAIVAVANKTARMVWVILNKGIDALPPQHLSA